MAVESRMFYYIRCDKCRGTAGGPTYEQQEGRVVLNSLDRGWLIEEGKHYCPNCVYTRYLQLQYKNK